MSENVPHDNEQMLREQIIARGVKNARVLDAMRHIDRLMFVPSDQAEQAYADGALPIQHRQTISQPYVVALMTDFLDPQPTDKALEIGSGSGYQTAVLAQLVHHVYSLEIHEDLIPGARSRLSELGLTNVTVVEGNGWDGLPQYAPFDKIIVTAAPEVVPVHLMQQLKIGGRMVIPVGKEEQELFVIDRRGPDDYHKRNEGSVRFVPMVHHPE